MFDRTALLFGADPSCPPQYNTPAQIGSRPLLELQRTQSTPPNKLKSPFAARGGQTRMQVTEPRREALLLRTRRAASEWDYSVQAQFSGRGLGVGICRYITPAPVTICSSLEKSPAWEPQLKAPPGEPLSTEDRDSPPQLPPEEERPGFPLSVPVSLRAGLAVQRSAAHYLKEGRKYTGRPVTYCN
ncbi:hypothetical protein SKAU_G00124490 [Synaphobranchus kaupii]|uniref:Uncharacterized protein n=1 Tax=Synaphobranchus kaupii TaxID=118154 RepID=A0A9Q1J2R8_SYNKA|nr:hypothetical protein SKAU_G00124490 [Synaphobranchus kaupii]